MVIGSGPIVIGQAAEFDYSGTQACKALREEGYEVVLVNSNPATIMTDTEMADRVYIEPITLETISAILRKERPQGIIATLGGQTGLNMAVELAENGILDELNIELLGTSLSSIRLAEDRELFKETMERIGEKIARSVIATSVEEAVAFAGEVGFPVIVRPAYTLGGTGGGIAQDMEQLKNITAQGLSFSMIGQVLLEQSVAGYKEIEYEVMRDAKDNCIVVCNMENLDPVGIHTGDSIVIAPSQTLSDKQYQMLRSASIRIIRALGIEGGCNIQFALNPNSDDYVVIEVNPRVSRSSALASKATGYPIARAAAKIAVGYGLDEITNPITGETCACFEPALDYVVTKVPRWPFDKFVTATRTLGTQMKATGEVMAIGRNFEESLLKAIDSLDVKLDYQLGMKSIAAWTDEEIEKSLRTPDDERIFVISEALERGWSVDEIFEITRIDRFFINKLNNIVQLAKELKRYTIDTLPPELLKRCKRYGFGDSYIANLIGSQEPAVKALRLALGILPTYKMVDTCAGEFEARTPYYYSCYEDVDESKDSGRKKVVVLGSGPIRIGQGIEFDYCSVHSVLALKSLGYESIIINSNPETVSTDFDTSDKLYFEPLTRECVLDVIQREKPEGVIVQFGGQTPLTLALPLKAQGVPIIGTDPANIDLAEDRKLFGALLERLGIPSPPNGTATSVEEACAVARRIGYPVLVRPSYVLGGRAMVIAYDEEMVRQYMREAVVFSQDRPVLIDRFLDSATEIDVDALSDGEDVLIAGIMEHIEEAGVHSGDSSCVLPPYSLSEEVLCKVREYTERLARALKVVGLMNVQYAAQNGTVYVLEVNPRASRTVPYVSKATGVPLAKIAVGLMLGKRLADFRDLTGGRVNGVLPVPQFFVKSPVFPFAKFPGVDPALGPEMRSTGEVMGVGENFGEAFGKAQLSAGTPLPDSGTVFISVNDRDKAAAVEVARTLAGLGFKLVATRGTAAALRAAGLAPRVVFKVNEGRPNAVDLLKAGTIHLVIYTTAGARSFSDERAIRRTTVAYRVPCITTISGARAAAEAIASRRRDPVRVWSLQEIHEAAGQPA